MWRDCFFNELTLEKMIALGLKLTLTDGNSFKVAGRVVP